jgi:vacuolar protein sorting-associated protein VTA1
LSHSELLTNDTAAYAHLENIALKIFLVADNEDRAGEASKKTAKMIYTASIFLEALKVFKELEPEVSKSHHHYFFTCKKEEIEIIIIIMIPH